MLKQGCRGYKKRQRRTIKDATAGLQFPAPSCRMEIARALYLFLIHHGCMFASAKYRVGRVCCAVIIIISSSCIIKGTRREYYHPPKLQINSERSDVIWTTGCRHGNRTSLSLSHFFSPLSITRQHQVRASFVPNKVERINFSCRQLGAWKNVDNAAIKSESIPVQPQVL